MVVVEEKERRREKVAGLQVILCMMGNPATLESLA